MIDFRYHLVSLVAVFLALAIGIALGAGPLREGISDTLEGEVGQLREERTDLRGQLEASRARDEARDEGISGLTDRSVAGSLDGVRVGVVLMPGADRNILDLVESHVETAGGDLVLRAEIDRDWEDLLRTDERLQLAEELSPLVDAPPARGVDAPTTRTVLAAVLAGADAEGRPGGWLAAGEALEDAGLVDLAWAATEGTVEPRPADTYLVVSGGLTTEAVGEDPGATVLEHRLALVDALARLQVPTVVIGQGGDGDPADGSVPVDPLVAAVRGERDLAAEVSTVDNTETAAGRLAATLALAWELEDDSGQYGLAPGAEVLLPLPLPLPAGGTTPPGDGTDRTAPVPQDDTLTRPGDSTGATSQAP